MKVHVAVWEWNDGNGEDPEVFVATKQELAEREAFRHMRMCVADEYALDGDDLPRWLPNNPPSAVDDGDPEAVRAWLAGFREATTAPWLTITEEAVEVTDA